jgi:hypothetical protein
VKVFALIPVPLVVLVSLCGSAVPPPATRTVAPTPTASPTPLPDIIAKIFDSAFLLWKPIFNIHGSTLHIAHVDSAIYVETTAGPAAAMLEPYHPGGLGVPDNSPVWVIVAYGQFQPTNIGVTDPTSGVHTTAWA